MTLAFPRQYFLGLSGLKQGGWDLQATELRCGMTYGATMLYGAGQWGAPSGQGPNGEGNGGQIYAQYAPPSGPLALECQMPPYEPAVEAILAANFPSSGAWKACAAVDNGLGYGRVWTREDTTNSWQPTTIWNNTTGASVQVRSLFAYTDSQTGVSYLFAGSDDTNGLGGIFHATYNANAPGNLVWDSTPELEISATNSGASFTARYDLPTASLVVTGVSAGALGVNMRVTDVGRFLPAGCMITGQTTGTQGGIGSYRISPAPTAQIAPEAMTASVTLPSGLSKRVMSIASGPNTAGGTSLYATVGIQVWERVDGARPTWQLAWTKPTVTSPNLEVSQSGLRGLTASGSNLLVFPEGTDWGVVKLTPASPAWTYSYLYTKSNLDSDLTTMLGGTTTATYVIGCYNNMQGVTVGSNFYGLIGLGIEVSAYPAGTPIYSPAGSRDYYLAQSHYLVKNGSTLTLCQMVKQTNPTAAVRFMVPFSTTYVVAGGFDYEDFTEAAEYGWGAYDTQANAVSGT